MAKKKKEDTKSIRQTEYRVEKNKNKKKENNIEKNKENSIKTKKNEEAKVEKDENLSTEFVEKGLPVVNKVDNENKLNNQVIRNDKMENKNGRVFVNFFLCFILLIGLVFFLLNLYLSKNSMDLFRVVSFLLLMLFTIFFVPIGLRSKNKKMTFIASLLLGGYFSIGIYTSLTGKVDSQTLTSGMKDFTNKNLTEVVKWAEKNNINLNQEYEYSDMIDEYEIINQSVRVGTNLKKVKDLTVVVSEGPNPNKEVMVPDMVSWDTERVINFVLENYLSNVEVEFVQSDKAVDTVIEQSKAGNLKRNDDLKITFSYGQELGYDEVKLIDFTNKTEFEVMFYMKQYHLNYEFKRDFSEKIKRNLAMKQNKEPGTSVKIEDETIEVTFSKGKEIVIPNLLGMSMSQITEWVIENRLKLEFSDKYDEKVKANKVLSVNYKKGDKVEQGETIKVVISKGSLKMPKFSSFEDFRTWADKYELKYEEKHEFSSSVKAGEVISYSYKTGEVIKNDDVIIVTISDGEAVKVPALDGLKKSEVETRLNKLGLKYSFVYKYSDNIKEGSVISQSISAGSEIAKTTTITITLSKGPKPADSDEGKNNTTQSNNDEEKEKPCVKETKTIQGNIRNVYNVNFGSTFSVFKAAYEKFFAENFPNATIKVIGLGDSGAVAGSPIGCTYGGAPSNCVTIGSEITSCNGVTYYFVIAQ